MEAQNLEHFFVGEQNPNGRNRCHLDELIGFQGWILAQSQPLTFRCVLLVSTLITRRQLQP